MMKKKINKKNLVCCYDEPYRRYFFYFSQKNLVRLSQDPCFMSCKLSLYFIRDDLREML